MTPRKRPAAHAQQRRRWATITETAEYYSLSNETIKRRIRDGKMKAYRPPGCGGIRIDLNEVDAAMVTVPSAVSA